MNCHPVVEMLNDTSVALDISSKCFMLFEPSSTGITKYKCNALIGTGDTGQKNPKFQRYVRRLAYVLRIIMRA